jgi:hypothetical protein
LEVNSINDWHFGWIILWSQHLCSCSQSRL